MIEVINEIKLALSRINEKNITSFTNDELSETSIERYSIASFVNYLAIPHPVFFGSPKTHVHLANPCMLTSYLPVRFPKYQSISGRSLGNFYNNFSNSNSTSSASLISLEKSAPIKPVAIEPIVLGLPVVPGCELESVGIKKMASRFPGIKKADLVRFLVARKGNVEDAILMMQKAVKWHESNLPLRSTPEVLRAISVKAFFPFGTDRDGAPILYFRGALYDSSKASAETYVLLAAHAMQWALNNSNCCALTVLVHSVAVPGAANESADTNFIGKFVKTLSDNFPERLKRLAIYPFPWYGRAIWSIVRHAIDKRTQDKVFLIPGNSAGTLPSELATFIDPDQVPVCCGGNSTSPILDLTTTLYNSGELENMNSNNEIDR